MRRSGFTLMETVIVSGIFALVSMAFVDVLVTVTGIHTRESASQEVSGQADLLLRTIQREVERASLIEMSPDLATSTLTLRLPASADDPTWIYASGTAVYRKRTLTGVPEILTSDKVNVTSLTFTKRSNTPGHDSISTAFTVQYNTANASAVRQALRYSVARTLAATFDSDIRASTSQTYKIGAAAQEWQSINNTIFFNSANVGIGIASPLKPLHVLGETFLDGHVGIGTSSPASAHLSVGTSTTALVAVFGGGSGKLNAGTIDPVYTIGGKQYATYVPGMIGVKEETTGVVALECRIGRELCSYVLDLGNAPVGSDLWLFAKTTDVKDRFDRLAVLLSPGFEGPVWYSKDADRSRLNIFGRPRGPSSEVSYRLSAPRFDERQWSNIAPSGEGEGFVISR